MAHLRKGETCTDLTCGFGIGTSTVYRYLREALELLAALAPTLEQAVEVAQRKAFVILDGTLLRIDRVGTTGGRDRPYYSGKRKVHGLNVQVLADPAGRLIWVSPPLPGARHDMGVAREHGIIDALKTAGISTIADIAYQGLARRCGCRSDGAVLTRTPVATGGCRAARSRSTPHMPVSAGPVNGPTPS